MDSRDDRQDHGSQDDDAFESSSGLDAPEGPSAGANDEGDGPSLSAGGAHASVEGPVGHASGFEFPRSGISPIVIDRATGLVSMPYPTLWVFAGLLALAVVVQILFALFVAGLGWSKDALGLSIMALLSSAAWPAVAALAIRFKKRDMRRSFAVGWLRADNPWLVVVLGVLAGFLMVLPAAWLEQTIRPHVPHASNTLLDILERGHPSWFAVSIMALAVSAGAPLSEELFFRGFAFSGMKRLYGSGIAAFSVSFLFAVVHLSWSAMAPIFLLSLVLCYLVGRADSIWPSVAAHMTYNGVQMAAWIGVWLKGTKPPSQDEPMPIEAVVLSILLLGVVLFAYRWATKPSRSTTAPGTIGSSIS
ncbi:MAG: CPBP family intramembrane metalloprotease [Deltaproteobacteria bacterium]|nr:CPBP family intramembrane metalloprotease [Deltaproteobacteria bacterium]